MRRHLAFPLAVLACALAGAAAPAHAQFLRDVFSKDGTDVIAVGDSGTVMRSVDSGVSWLQTKVGAKPLRAVVARGLTVIAGGDSGKVWRSTDSGFSWALAVLPGTPTVRSIAWPADAAAWLVGDGGAVYFSADGGASWSPQSSGTSNALNRVRFKDANEGWMVGNGGFAAHTTNGGVSWTPSTVGTANHLLSVDFAGSAVWAVGANGCAYSSATGGASWTPRNLRLDAASAVNDVQVASLDTITIAGGGGFIRKSTDGGISWTFQRSTYQSPVASLFLRAGKGWMCGPATKAVLRTNDGGANWLLPAGNVQTRNWVTKLSVVTSVRGATLALNPKDHKTLYCMMGATLYRSRDDGETWSTVGSVPGVTKTNAFVISPKDTNLMVAAVGTPDRIVRSDNGGVTWNDQFAKEFGEYGIPLEMHPDKPDTLYFGPDADVLYRSIDFGKTWAPYSATIFRSPCDIIAVPESDSGVVIVGDGITSSGIGEILRSNDQGVNYVKTFSPTSPPSQGSEIPGMSISRLRTSSVYATAWSSGTFKRSVNNGLSWSTSYNITSSWGTDVAKDDPDCVIFGTYSFGNCLLSFDGGATHTATAALAGSNYSFYARDRALMLAEQSGGIQKLVVSDAFTVNQAGSVAVTAPNGGEVWDAGSVRSVTWTATRVPLVKIEWRSSGSGTWQTVALVDGYLGAYDWTVPNVATTDAHLRVSDAWDASPIDEGNAAFTIRTPGLLAGPDPLDLGTIEINTVANDTLHIENTGLAPLTIIAVTSDDATFWPGRTSLTLAPGASDTIGVFYGPTTVGADTAHFTIVSNDPLSPKIVLVTGTAQNLVGVGEGGALAFALGSPRPNPFSTSTTLRFTLPTRERVELDVYDVTGHRVATLARGEYGPGVHDVSFGAGARDSEGRLLGQLSSGVYFYRLEAGRFTATKKVLLVR